MTHRQADHGLAAFGEILIIAHQTAVAAQPGEGALNNPTVWLNRKALDILLIFGLWRIGLLDDL